MVILIWKLSVVPAVGQLPAIELTAISPTAATVGSEFDIQLLAGGQLQEVTALRFSVPGITAVPSPEATTKPDGADANTNRFRVTVSQDVRPGFIEVRAIGRHGISNPRVLRITERPCVSLGAASHDIEHATELSLETLLLTHCAPSQIDYYSLPLKKGQSLRVRMTAQAIDSRMIGQLNLLDAHGNVLQSARGADFVDPEMIVPGDHDGRAILAVHDFLYRGGNELPYQLFVEPIASDDAASTGPRDDRQAWFEALMTSIADRSEGRLSLPFETNAFALHRLLDPPLPIEWLPLTGDAQPATIVQPPCRVGGSFQANRGPDGEWQAVGFETEKGERWAVEVFSQRLGQPTDVRLAIEQKQPSADGVDQWRQVQLTDDSQEIGDGAVALRTTDPVCLFEAPETGSYRVVLRDLDTGEALGVRQHFLLEIRRPNPGFDLLAYRPVAHKDIKQSKPGGANVVRGGVDAFRVFVVRRDGWTGPVEVTAQGLPEAVSGPSVWIPVGQDQAQLNVVAGTEAKPWQGSILLRGRDANGDTGSVVDASPAVIQWGQSGSRPFVRSRLATELAMAVSEQAVCPVSVHWGNDAATEVAAGETVTIPVRLTRREGGNGACVLRPRDLPAGVTAGEVTIAADQSEGTIELKLAPNVATGSFTPWLQAETPVKTPQDLTLYIPSNNTTIRVVSP